MTAVALFAAGAAALALVSVDVLMTTLKAGAGAGPMTRSLLAGIWRVLLRLHRRDTGSRLMTAAGPGLLVLTVLVWVLFLWGGWSLIFLAGGDPVEQSSTGAPADAAETVYYVGFTVFTLGVGDFVATSSAWRLVSDVATFSGLFLVTLAITYLLSVVSAVVSRRALAIRIHSLGNSATDMLSEGWSDGQFSSAFVQHLVALAGDIAENAQQHLAYPVLNFFHSGAVSTSAPVALAQLDEAMLLAGAAVAPSARPATSAVLPVRRAIDHYLSAAMGIHGGRHPAQPPPVPSLAGLTGSGIPVVDQAELDRHAGEESAHRCRLMGFVHDDGWSWHR